MPKFTVIGLWEDDGQTYAESVEAGNPHEAMQAIAAGNPYEHFTIIGAVLGEHNLTAPCEDSNKSAAASDLVEKDR